MTDLEQAINTYQDKAFGPVDVSKAFRKLGEEIGELGESLMNRAAGGNADADDAVIEEIADCAIILQVLLCGIDPELGLNRAMLEKFTALRKRVINREPRKYATPPNFH